MGFVENENPQDLGSNINYYNGQNNRFFNELFSCIAKNRSEIPYIQILLNNLNNLASELGHISLHASKNGRNCAENELEITTNSDCDDLRLVEGAPSICNITQIYNGLFLKVVEGLANKGLGHGFSTRYGIWNFNLTFPIICFTITGPPSPLCLLKEVESILRNELLWRLGLLYQHEAEFKRNFEKESAEITNKEWSILIELLSKQMGNDFTYPTSKAEAVKLYSEYDTYDAYIRSHREVELKKLKNEAENLENGSMIKTAFERCLKYFEADFKHKSITVNYINYDDILVPHPEREKGNQWVKEWIPTCFLDPNVVKYYLKDTLLFDCCNYLYAFLPSIKLVSELGKLTLLALYLDGLAEVDCAFVAIWVDALEYEISGATHSELDSWKHSRCNEFENAALRGFINVCRNINELANCDITSAWKEFVTNVKTIHETKFKTSEEYFAARLIDIGIDPFNVVVCAHFGRTIKDIPLEINYTMLNYCGIENDLYSFGKESMDAKMVLQANSISVFQNIYPNMSKQSVVFMLESIRDKHWVESVSKWKGTENDHWYHICLAIGYTMLCAYRYQRAFIMKSKSTVLIRC